MSLKEGKCEPDFLSSQLHALLGELALVSWDLREGRGETEGRGPCTPAVPKHRSPGWGGASPGWGDQRVRAEQVVLRGLTGKG